MTEGKAVAKRVTRCEGDLRWLHNISHRGNPMTLQQCWRITETFDNGDVVSRTEWRDVPTVTDGDAP